MNQDHSHLGSSQSTYFAAGCQIKRQASQLTLKFLTSKVATSQVNWNMADTPTAAVLPADWRGIILWNKRQSKQLEHFSSPTHLFATAVYTALAHPCLHRALRPSPVKNLGSTTHTFKQVHCWLHKNTTKMINIKSQDEIKSFLTSWCLNLRHLLVSYVKSTLHYHAVKLPFNHYRQSLNYNILSYNVSYWQHL